MTWNRKAALEWTIDQIENKLSGIYNTIDALFYLQGSTFVNQCNEIVEVPTFSDSALTERQQKLFINELAKHIPGITWEQYQTYKTEKEKEAQAIIEARKQVNQQKETSETQENTMTATMEIHEETTQNHVNSEYTQTTKEYLQYFSTNTVTKEVNKMKHINATTALIAITKLIKKRKDNGNTNAVNDYFGTRTILYMIDQADYTSSDEYNQLKNILFTLEKYGYIKSIIGENIAITGYRKIQGKTFKERQWRITPKGIEKVKEIVQHYK